MKYRQLIQLQILSIYLSYLVLNMLVSCFILRYPFRVISHRSKFQTIQFSISIVFVYIQLNIETIQLNVKTVLFQTIQFSLSTQFSSTWPIDRNFSGASTASQSGPGSDGNKGVRRILKSSSFTEASLSDCLVPYPGHSLGELYHSLEMLSVYSINPADWPMALNSLHVLLSCYKTQPIPFFSLSLSLSLSLYCSLLSFLI